jgi:hypothetical protein
MSSLTATIIKIAIRLASSAYPDSEITALAVRPCTEVLPVDALDPASETLCVTVDGAEQGASGALHVVEVDLAYMTAVSGWRQCSTDSDCEANGALSLMWTDGGAL